MKKFSFTVDVNAKTIPTDYSWQFGIGNDHAYMLHRNDVCEHIKTVHDELGIKSVRFHGIFDGFSSKNRLFSCVFAVFFVGRNLLNYLCSK